MTIQFGLTLRDARANLIESTISTAPKFQVRTGAPPANCAAADSGTLLCEISLPSDWLNASSAGQVTKLGTWSGTGVADGVAAHFRIKNTAGSVCHIQGTISETSGDAIIDNENVGNGAPVSVNTFTLTEGNP